MRTELHRLRSAIYSQPWAIKPEMLGAICDIYETHAAGGHIEFDAALRRSLDEMRRNANGYSVDRGVAIVPLVGPIFPRANMLTDMSGATSLERYMSALEMAVADPKVEATFQVIDSPGGSVMGVFEAARRVFELRKGPKPIITLVQGEMCSAAYAIGSQADAVYATEASIVGSIGVVMQINDSTRQMRNEGMDPIVIKTGKYKAIGAGQITDDQVESLRGMVADYFGRFKDAVSRARQEIDIEAVSTGEVWIGQKAVDMKLVDEITTLDSLISRYSSQTQ